MESFNAACVFCDETFSSSKAMSDHLVLCGNKTDLCPTCRRFIRRAIYAYHFENNCANLDESTGSARSNSNSTGARQTSKMFIYLSYILKNSIFFSRNVKHDQM
jgi:hypothetical protein